MTMMMMMMMMMWRRRRRIDEEEKQRGLNVGLGGTGKRVSFCYWILTCCQPHRPVTSGGMEEAEEYVQLCQCKRKGQNRRLRRFDWHRG